MDGRRFGVIDFAKDTIDRKRSRLKSRLPEASGLSTIQQTHIFFGSSGFRVGPVILTNVKDLDRGERRGSAKERGGLLGVS
jgi:hypothetical protein